MHVSGKIHVEMSRIHKALTDDPPECDRRTPKWEIIIRVGRTIMSVMRTHKIYPATNRPTHL